MGHQSGAPERRTSFRLYNLVKFASAVRLLHLAMITRRFTVLASTLVSVQYALGGQSSDPALWESFVLWLQDIPPDDFKQFPQLLAEYRLKLMRDGNTAAEAEQVVQEISRLRKAEPARAQALTALAYNKLYTATKRVFTEAPNKLLVDTVQSLRPGMALDIAMGEGRNAIYLASRGWDVTGFDIADEGLRKAKAKASVLGLGLNAIKATIDDFDWGTNRWDLIVRMYAPDGPIERALKPGGLFVMENPADGASSEAEPSNPYPSLRLLKYEKVTTKADWGTRASMPLVRIVARKEH